MTINADIHFKVLSCHVLEVPAVGFVACYTGQHSPFNGRKVLGKFISWPLDLYPYRMRGILRMTSYAYIYHPGSLGDETIAVHCRFLAGHVFFDLDCELRGCISGHIEQDIFAIACPVKR